MERVDQPNQSIVSVFKQRESAPELMQSMRDIASLSGVLSELGSQTSFQSPGDILRFLRIIQLINEEALGMSDPIENADTIYYRYRNQYEDSDPPSKSRIERIVNILVNNNWVSKQARQLKMRDAGKRMMDALIRLANDSLAYYMHDDIGRSLFQAKRDAEISEAYDDKGISGGNKISSMIRNVENAIQLLKERELEMLADRNALPQLEVIHSLMDELEKKLEERLAMFRTFEDSLIVSDLVQKGTAALAEGTSLSLGMIRKYISFTSMQNTPLSSTIAPEKVRTFIAQMFDPPLDSDIPNVYQLFSFMEQDQYEGEAIDGLWVPIKFAAPLSPMDIEEAIEHLEFYEPITESELKDEADIVFEEDLVSEEEANALLGDSAWLMMKSMINTEMIEQYLDDFQEAELEELIIESSSSEWSDAITGLTAIAALEGNKKILKKRINDGKKYTKKWGWMNDEDRRYVVRKRRGE